MYTGLFNKQVEKRDSINMQRSHYEEVPLYVPNCGTGTGIFKSFKKQKAKSKKHI